MSLNKAIKSRKKHRKQYKGGKLYSSSCHNHGSCPYCKSNRRYKDFREKAKYHKNKKDYIDDIIDNEGEIKMTDTDYDYNYKNNVDKSAYMQGIEDMKEIILTIEQMYDNSNDNNDNDILTELFGCSHDNYRMIFDNFTVSEIQDKIKHYKQLTEVPIQIGDIVKYRKADNPINLLVIAIGNSYNPHLAYCNVMDSKGKVYRPIQLLNLYKTGKHIDISNILKELEKLQ